MNGKSVEEVTLEEWRGMSEEMIEIIAIPLDRGWRRGDDVRSIIVLCDEGSSLDDRLDSTTKIGRNLRGNRERCENGEEERIRRRINMPNALVEIEKRKAEGKRTVDGGDGSRQTHDHRDTNKG